MAESHPFSNAGLGMFGSAEKQFAQSGMHAKAPKDEEGNEGGGLGNFVAGALKSLFTSKEDKLKSYDNLAPTQFDPATNFPSVFNQQYATPYLPGAAPSQGIAPPASSTSLEGFKQAPLYAAPPPMQGFKTQPNYVFPSAGSNAPMSPQVGATQQYNPLVDQIWKR